MKSAKERFFEKVVKTKTCWFWTAYITQNGYGQFHFEGKMVAAHRWSYFHAGKSCPSFLVLDHLCRVSHCVNPDHLEAVTQKENTLRGDNQKSRDLTNAQKINCRQCGEKYLRTKYGRKYCAACGRKRANAWYAAKIQEDVMKGIMK